MELPTLAKALRLPYFPITANQLLLGPLGTVAYFPAKFKLRVLEPVRFDVPPDQERYSKSRIMDESEHDPRPDPVRALRHAAHPPVGVVRMSDAVDG